MANYGIKLDIDGVNTLHGDIQQRLQNVQAEHDQYTSAVSGYQRDAELTRAQVAAASAKERKRAAEKLGGMVGDLDSVQSALAAWARFDDVQRLAENAQMLPPIIDSESTAADARRRANRDEVLTYRERLQRLDVDRLIEEAADLVREAGTKPEQSAALAKLRELHWHSKGLQGSNGAKARSAVTAAWAGIEKNWEELHGLRAKRDGIAEAVDEIEERLAAVSSGVASKRIVYFDWRRKRAAAA